MSNDDAQLHDTAEPSGESQPPEMWHSEAPAPARDRRRPASEPPGPKANHHAARLDGERRRSVHRDQLDRQLRRSACADRVRAIQRQSPRQVAPEEAFGVLVAEDDHDLRRLLVSVLRADGYHVIEARDGQEMQAKAMASLRGRSAAPVDLVLADIHMPKMSGIDALAAIRRIDGNVPIVLISSDRSSDLEAEAVAAGADAVLSKPLDLEQVRELINRLAGS